MKGFFSAACLVCLLALPAFGSQFEDNFVLVQPTTVRGCAPMAPVQPIRDCIARSVEQTREAIPIDPRLTLASPGTPPVVALWHVGSRTTARVVALPIIGGLNAMSDGLDALHDMVHGR